MPSEQPTYHGYAVNVKDHGFYDVERGPLTDGQVDAIYQESVADFWNVAQDIAQDHGFRGVFSEGRMGGWAEVDPQPDVELLEERGEVGDDPMAEWMEERFRPLERDLLALMAECREGFLVRLAFEVERANAEPAERAYWEARDTITV